LRQNESVESFESGHTQARGKWYRKQVLHHTEVRHEKQERLRLQPDTTNNESLNE
jgi:hypothetical protein